MKYKSIFLIFISAVILMGITHAQEQVSYKNRWTYKTKGWAKAVSISEDGNRLAAGSSDTFAYFFDRNGNLLWKYRTGGLVNSVSISPDGNYTVVSSGDTNSYFFYNNASISKRPLWAFDTGTKDASLVSVSRDGLYTVLASRHPDNKIHFLNKKGKFLWSYKIPDIIRGLSISSDGSYVVAGSANSLVHLIDKNGKLLWSFDMGKFSITSISMTKNGSHIAVGTRDNKVYLLENYLNRRGVHIWDTRISGELVHVSFLSNGSSIVTQSKENKLNFFSLKGELLNEAQLNSSLGRISLSNDGRYIAAASKEPRTDVYLYEQESKIEVSQSKRIIILANSIDDELAAGFYGFLKEQGFTAIRVTPSSFDEFNKEGYVIILGGPDAPEGVGEIVKDSLTTAEENNVREKGSMKIYIKTDRWADNQKIIVFAGSDRNHTKSSHEKYREKVISEFET